MLRRIVLTALLAGTMPALADGDHCKQLYQQMLTKTSADPDSCIPVIPPTEAFEQCVKPFDYAGARQASHVVMILDASGSMAGQLNGDSKMNAAKREAAKFLNDLAADLPVGLMVYGHLGTNQESGKAESCAGIEMMRPIGKSRRDVSDSIRALQPTGWTPMAASLAYAEQEFGNLPPVKEGVESVPVVYLVSDGEETCGGDPVAAARSLHESGVQATVNVIGFDVDAATRAQLEAISAAGGGQFFPAKDAAALRAHLNAASAAEQSHARFQKCIFENESRANRPIYKALQGFAPCMNRQSETNFAKIMRAQLKALGPEDDKQCGLEISLRIGRDQGEITKPLLKLYNDLLDQQQAARAAARELSVLTALPPKQ
ncbi:VWA domain-containing protein [uncultured Litoreibacter sp.]|uniref:vWA domain-containing protein n=1 Tax=uncultured Litoreibacter sp. TaxID=1392394 RepID=UPI00260458C2|nr:VWA domain-containing protein [uncultured Litoreibacter sp.]